MAPATPASAAASAFSAAVEARFPEPAVNYRTPAFEPGRTGFTTNAELHDALQALVRENGPGGLTVRSLPLATSQRGTPLDVLLFTRLPDADPAAMRATGRPTVLIVGQQHGNEPAGSEALLVIARELAGGRLGALLDRLNVIVWPRVNPDGAASDQRASASGIDINRDHLLLRTPEAQGQAQLLRDYAPVLVIDAHEYTVGGRFVEKFGAVQKYDALVQYAMTPNNHEFLTKASEEWFRQPLLAALKSRSLSNEWYYTTSTDPADRKVAMGGVQPDTGRNVAGLNNAVSFLIETRGIGIGRSHFKRRVYTHVTAIESLLDSAAKRSADLAKLRAFVDNDVAASSCKGELVVEAAATPSEYELKMLDPLTGADKELSVSWDSALALQPLRKRTRPCGYWLAADQTDAVLRLRGLGLTVQQISENGVMRGESYVETARQDGVRQDVRGTIADGNGVVRVQVSLRAALVDVPAGSYYVPLDQPWAGLAIAALEPDSQNSFVAHRILAGVQSEVRVMAVPEVPMTPVP